MYYLNMLYKNSTSISIHAFSLVKTSASSITSTIIDHCSPEEKHMECEVDPNMSIVGVTHAKVSDIEDGWHHWSDASHHYLCTMSLTLRSHRSLQWYGAPGPMFCGPKTSDQPHSGFWDHNYECECALYSSNICNCYECWSSSYICFNLLLPGNKSWANPPETCDVYEGQKAGRYDQSRPYANSAGRTDVEGCCWWGRGVIQTSGVWWVHPCFVGDL